MLSLTELNPSDFYEQDSPFRKENMNDKQHQKEHTKTYNKAKEKINQENTNRENLLEKLNKLKLQHDQYLIRHGDTPLAPNENKKIDCSPPIKENQTDFCNQNTRNPPVYSALYDDAKQREIRKKKVEIQVKYNLLNNIRLLQDCEKLPKSQKQIKNHF